MRVNISCLDIDFADIGVKDDCCRSYIFGYAEHVATLGIEIILMGVSGLSDAKFVNREAEIGGGCAQSI